jgi:sec-independent protein translocase protein TatA
MPPVGPTQLILILGILVLTFGAGRLAEVGGALGRSVREFRQATEDNRAATSRSDRPRALPTCRRCGVVLHRGARYCGSCGTALAENLAGALVSAGTNPPASGHQ